MHVDLNIYNWYNIFQSICFYQTKGLFNMLLNIQYIKSPILSAFYTIYHVPNKNIGHGDIVWARKQIGFFNKDYSNLAHRVMNTKMTRTGQCGEFADLIAYNLKHIAGLPQGTVISKCFVDFMNGSNHAFVKIELPINYLWEHINSRVLFVDGWISKIDNDIYPMDELNFIDFENDIVSSSIYEEESMMLFLASLNGGNPPVLQYEFTEEVYNDGDELCQAMEQFSMNGFNPA
ncbi:hypothetical protein [Legionella oakridgensis]|nr:hypothetical protein [Legionella oakridgensis]